MPNFSWLSRLMLEGHVLLEKKKASFLQTIMSKCIWREKQKKFGEVKCQNETEREGERETKVSFETVGHALYHWVVGGGWGVIQLTSLRLLFLPLHLFSFLHHGLPFDCVFVVAVAATANVFQYPAEPQKPRLVAFIVSASSLRIDLRSLAPLIVWHFVHFSDFLFEIIIWRWVDHQVLFFC